MFIALTRSGSPPLSAAWRAGFWPSPADTTLPMMHSSTLYGIDTGALDGLPHHDRAQLRRAQIGERALKSSDRRARRRHNHHVFHKCHTPLTAEENSMPNIIRWVYLAPRRTNPG